MAVGGSLSNFMTYAKSQKDDSCLYVFEPRFADRHPDMANEYTVRSPCAVHFKERGGGRGGGDGKGGRGSARLCNPNDVMSWLVATTVIAAFCHSFISLSPPPPSLFCVATKTGAQVLPGRLL